MSDKNKQNAEFLNSLTKNDVLVNPIYNPEAWAMRSKAQGAAARGDMPRTNCRHPLNAIMQFVDDDPQVKRNSKPVNLFECSICHTLLWFTDPWGQEVSDG